MNQWQPQAFNYLLKKDYVKAIGIYEEAIANESEVIAHYFYLGLIQLLQGQETEAQFTWMAGVSDGASSSEIEIWTSELVEILCIEALRRRSNAEYETAFLICQHIHAIEPNNLDNLFILVSLSIQLETLDEENVAFIQFIENLGKFKTKLSHDLWELLSSLLKYPPYPLLIEFTKASLPFIAEPNPFIYSLIKAAIDLAYYQRREDLAIALLELCLQLSPKNLEVLEHLCRIHLKICAHSKGLETARLYSRLSERAIDKVFANTLLLKSLLEKGSNWEETLLIFANQKSLLSDLIAENPTELSSSVIYRLYTTDYFTPYIEDNPSINRRLQNQISQLCQTNTKVDLVAQMQKFRQRSGSNSQKLKIGYISRCMATHSVGWLGRWLIQHHDRSQFEIYGYFLAYRQYPDELQSWFERQMDRVYQGRVDDCVAIADQISQDGIDILIDLDSYSFDITCGVLALKPAPIQVSWLGCDASGIPTVDYFIADPYVLPHAAQAYYSEKIWRLPQTYIAVDGFEIGIPTLRRDQLNIPADAVVYLSAQNAFKRHPDNVRLQMQIIKSVSNSYFLIKGLGDQDSIKEFFTEIAIAEGVDPERLVFLPMTPTEAIHRANLAIADIVLDTYPYNGATTTLETLWMGIPIVTKAGEQFVARNSYSMMINAGITQGIAWTDAEYVEWGVRLGKDASLRQDISNRLKASRQTSPLWNGQQFAKEMERAYQQMWEIYLKS